MAQGLKTRTLLAALTMLAANPGLQSLPPKMCPKCHYVSHDFDELGVLLCEVCGYCSHPSSSGDPMRCDNCGVST